jgi:hypothetical protein
VRTLWLVLVLACLGLVLDGDGLRRGAGRGRHPGDARAALEARLRFPLDRRGPASRYCPRSTHRDRLRDRPDEAGATSGRRRACARRTSERCQIQRRSPDRRKMSPGPPRISPDTLGPDARGTGTRPRRGPSGSTRGSRGGARPRRTPMQSSAAIDRASFTEGLRSSGTSPDRPPRRPRPRRPGFLRELAAVPRAARRRQRLRGDRLRRGGLDPPRGDRAQGAPRPRSRRLPGAQRVAAGLAASLVRADVVVDATDRGSARAAEALARAARCSARARGSSWRPRRARDRRGRAPGGRRRLPRRPGRDGRAAGARARLPARRGARGRPRRERQHDGALRGLRGGPGARGRAGAPAGARRARAPIRRSTSTDGTRRRSSRSSRARSSASRRRSRTSSARTRAPSSPRAPGSAPAAAARRGSWRGPSVPIPGAGPARACALPARSSRAARRWPCPPTASRTPTGSRTGRWRAHFGTGIGPRGTARALLADVLAPHLTNGAAGGAS